MLLIKNSTGEKSGDELTSAFLRSIDPIHAKLSKFQSFANLQTNYKKACITNEVNLGQLSAPAHPLTVKNRRNVGETGPLMNNFSSAIKDELLHLAQLEHQHLLVPEQRKQGNHSYLSDGSLHSQQ